MFNMVGLLPAVSYSPSIRRHPRCIRPSPFGMIGPRISGPQDKHGVTYQLGPPVAPTRHIRNFPM